MKETRYFWRIPRNYPIREDLAHLDSRASFIFKCYKLRATDEDGDTDVVEPLWPCAIVLKNFADLNNEAEDVEVYNRVICWIVVVATVFFEFLIGFCSLFGEKQGLTSVCDLIWLVPSGEVGNPNTWVESVLSSRSFAVVGSAVTDTTNFSLKKSSVRSNSTYEKRILCFFVVS